ncbi:hypothetical protein M405DRAFT_699075, partial [Rhizopogon salebrosus TDB-379]
MVHFKNKNHHGQREGTRSHTLIDGVQHCVDSWAQKYRDAHKAKLLLSGPGPWEEVLRPLEPGNMRSYVDPEIPTWKPVNTSDPSGLDDSLMDDTMDRADRRQPTGETRRTFSWIWISIPAAIARGEEGMDDILHAEWLKSRAWAARWTEEVQLLREEMRHVLAFLEWRSNWWKECPVLRQVDTALAEALRAFASEQAQLQLNIVASFRDLWRKPL